MLMKKMYIIISCIIFTLMNFHCGKKNGSITHIQIGPRVKKMQKIFMSQYISDIHYIPLQGSSNLPLAWNWNILTDFSDKYILESNGNICLLYDHKGHFIRQIGKLGRGPGEYMGIHSVYLLNNSIYIRDFLGDDLIEYKIDGTLVKRYKIGFTIDEKYRLEKAIMINDSIIFGNIENRTGKEEYKALVINKQGRIKYSFKNFDLFSLESGIRGAKAPGEAILFRFGPDLFFKEFYNDTLFRI